MSKISQCRKGDIKPLKSDKITKNIAMGRFNMGKCLEEKFETIRNGKGVAFTVPLSSVIGVSMYQFLSNNRQSREG